jgi:hypothetical protein
MDLIYYSSPDTEDYWSGRYNELSNDLGPADALGLPVGKMQAMGLRYAGEDSGGKFWVSRSGKKYYADPLGGSGNNEDSTGAPNVGGAGPGVSSKDWQSYLPPTVNPVLNANNPVLDRGPVTNAVPVMSSGYAGSGFGAGVGNPIGGGAQFASPRNFSGIPNTGTGSFTSGF